MTGCEIVASHASGGAASILIVELGDDPHRNDLLGRLLVSHRDIVAPEELTGALHLGTFKNCIDAFAAATHAVVELDYFDADYRSNATATIGTRHARAELRTNRLVFLEAGDTPDDLADVAVTLAFVDASTPLGYMVLTPDPGGPIGRSLIPPPLEMPSVKPDVDVPAHVRTIVREQISILGNLREVRGVPFIEQDGNLFSCAHAGAWMTHYAAVLRGLSTRRHTVQFFAEAAGNHIMSRPTPPEGLTSDQIVAVLERLGLPVEVLDTLSLDRSSRFGQWYDRQEIWELGNELKATSGVTDPDAKALDHFKALVDRCDEFEEAEEADLTALAAGEELARTEEQRHEAHLERMRLQGLITRLDAFWTMEHLTRTVCQYLNSGFPAISLMDGHAKVITGYLRRKNLRDAGDGNPESSDVAAFIVADDQRGPYRILRTERLARGIHSRYSVATVLIPLQRGVWMRAADAEDMGAAWFAKAVPRLLDDLDIPERRNLYIKEGDLHRLRSELSAINDQIISTHPSRRKFAVRSYVVPGTDFKRGLAHRCAHDPIAVSQVRLANLSKFVWVVEVLDREQRRPDNPCVIGEVVWDATDTDAREANALIVHVPGAIQVKSSEKVSAWQVSGVTGMYPSGRYHQNSDWAMDSDAAAARWKQATG